jgi:glycosyltransferase involved in cell wall biosynthesis
MRFSIVIPAHNGEKFLASAIVSALKQSREAEEIVLVDDASTDKTAAIATSGEWGGKVRYYYNPISTGFADAWNRCIAKATGDFVTILHQDDILYQEYLEHIEKAVRKYPHVRHFYAACNYIDEQGAIIKRPFGNNSLEPVLYSGKKYARNYLNGVVTNNHIHRCPGVTTQRMLLLDECTYRKEAGHIADDDFFLRVGAFTDVAGISYPLASYREHAGSETSRLKLLTLELAKDYVFQANYYKEHNMLFDADGVTKINRMAVRFINMLLFQALLYGNKEWLKKAFDLRIELERSLYNFMNDNSALWAQLMWRMTGLKGNNCVAFFYVRLLNSIRSFRDIIKKLVVR